MSRPKVITLSPVANDDNGLSTNFTYAAASLEAPLDGTLASGYDRNGIATAQTPGSATDLTLDGVLASNGTIQFTTPTRVAIYAAGDESGKTFTVTGRAQDPGKQLGAARPVTETITGPNATSVFGATEFWTITSIAASAATAGDVEVGPQGKVTLATAQHITIVSAGDDSGDTFTVTGEDRYGIALTEDITGANAATATGTKNFKVVTQVVTDGASAGNVETGVSGTCESAWFVLNYRGPDFNVGFGVDISSGANLTYDVEHTFNNVLAASFAEDDATVFNHDAVNSQTANADGNYTNPPVAMRLAITAHTSGSANLRVVQTGRS